MIAVDMRMPEKCEDCRFMDGIYGFCHAMPEPREAMIGGKPRWCPLLKGDLLKAEQVVGMEEASIMDNSFFETLVRGRLGKKLADAIANDIAAVVWQSDDDDRFEDFKRVRAYVHVVAEHADKDG